MSEENETGTGEIQQDPAVLRDEWLQREGPKDRINVQKFILGEIVSNIIGDDGNYFPGPQYYDVKHGDEGFPERVIEMQQGYTMRLNREIGTPGLPADIVDELRKTVERVKLTDWTDRQIFLNARDEWFNLRDKTKQKLTEDPELKDSFEYYQGIVEVVNKWYLDSLNQSKQ